MTMTMTMMNGGTSQEGDRVARFASHEIPVYILTIGNLERVLSMQHRWQACLNHGREDCDIMRFLFFGINGGQMWGRPNNRRRWRKGMWKTMVRKGVVQPLSGPALHNLTPGEVAVALGMLSILSDIACSNYDRALILEDDANFLVSNAQDEVLDITQSAEDVYRKLCAVLDAPLTWHVLRVGSCFSRGFVSLMPLCQGFSVGRVDAALCCHGMLVSREACRLFTQHCLPLCTTIDHQLLLVMQSLGMSQLEVHPHFVGQELLLNPERSIIQYSRDEQLFLRWLQRHSTSPERLAASVVRVKQILSQLFHKRLRLQ